MILEDCQGGKVGLHFRRSPPSHSFLAITDFSLAQGMNSTSAIVCFAIFSNHGNHRFFSFSSHKLNFYPAIFCNFPPLQILDFWLWSAKIQASTRFIFQQKTMKNLTDEKLLEICSRYGKLALHYRRKFIGLLPEVNRRKLYEKKGFNSIFEFAAKLAGISQEQVKRTISLDKTFSDKPILHEALTNGKVSLNKLARIASVATVENQEYLTNQVSLLSKSAVETLVRDMKFVPGHKSDEQNGLFQTHDTHERSECASLPKLQNLKLSPEVIAKLFELQNKGLDINEMILEFLKQREQKIETEKAEISARASAKENSALATAKKPSRHISVQTKKLLHAIHGSKCAVPHCQKPSKEIHHTARFALSNSNNPNFLAPLCHEHHLIAHTIDQNLHQKRAITTQ